MLIPDLDVPTVLERGRVAGKLMQDAAFNAVVNDLTGYHLAALVAAPPGDSGREARDYHHLMQHALTEICRDLSQRASAAAELRRRLELAIDEDE